MNDLDFSPEALEEQISSMQEVDEFSAGSVDYDQFVVLSKKELFNFCRVVEPLTKAAIDAYGKSIYIECVDNDTVALKYVNAPFVVQANVTNKSGKTVNPFAISVSTLRKLVSQTFASIILVEQDGEMNIALCESLLYLETTPLSGEQYAQTRRETPLTIDKDAAIHTFRKIGASLSLTDRASEKTIVIKDKLAHFNTGVFVARTISPFSGKENFVIYKQVADIIAIIAELSKVGVNYGIYDDIMALTSEGYYLEVQVGDEEKVSQFLSPTSEVALSFNAGVQIINDNLLRIITVVGGLEYLSDILTLNFTDEYLELVIASTNQSKKSSYKFTITGGSPTVKGEMKVTVPVMKLFLSIVGTDAKFEFNEVGLGIETPQGKFLLRKS